MCFALETFFQINYKHALYALSCSVVLYPETYMYIVSIYIVCCNDENKLISDKVKKDLELPPSNFKLVPFFLS